MLQLRNITKTYKVGDGKIVALDKVNIDFPEKGLVFIVGKSGSGKSTLLNILGGLDQMDSGEIIINGRSTKDFSNSDFDAYRNYHIGFIFQEFNLIDEISVKENIAIALKIQSKGHDATTIDEALKLVNLEGLGYRTPKELSGGQKQRIAVARALVKNPNIILADEPTGALDSKTGYDLMSSLKSLSTNKLVIVVTHDAEMANIFGDEIVKLTDGKIIDHLIISPDYVKPENEKITNKIIKISSGHEINDENIINDALNKEKTNYVCLTSNPQILTNAYPEAYEKVFVKEDLSKKFISKNGKLDDIERKTSNDSSEKAKIEFKECFKMALNHFKNSKGRFLFLLIFTIISFSLLGFTYTMSRVNNDNIIANTLSNNNIELGIMEKYSENGKQNFNVTDINKLKDTHENNFAIGKTVKMPYTMSAKPTHSAFEMGEFKGIVECDNITDLNLNILEGEASFNPSSLKNHEIIISDYAAFELRRTGYLGKDNNGEYGIIKPKDIKEQINSSIIINNLEYKIIGIFDTNFEEFLPLLVSEVKDNNEKEQVSSLNALKSYYYARIFGPYGFYKNYIIENGNNLPPTYFQLKAEQIPVYKYDNENDTILDTYTYTNYFANNIEKFYDFNEVNLDSSFRYNTIWGQVPSKLLDNQIILSYDFLRYNGLFDDKQYDKALEALNSNIIITKQDQNDSNKAESIIYDKGFEVVAIIDIETPFYEDIPAYYSSTMEDMLTESIYSYDQILFTLSGNKLSYANTIKGFSKEGYSVLNIDGRATYGAESLYSLKAIVGIATIVMTLFALLIMFNYSLNNVKTRKKEIGILRATGARGRDVIKIFGVEEGILASIVGVCSLIIVAILSNFINKIFGNIEIGIQLIVFNILDIFVILLIIYLIYGITTLLPIIGVARMKPIDAIRKI